MSARNRPYEQFGSYVLFKKLESDALTELWRAGRIDGSSIAGTAALRRFHAGNRESLVAVARAARDVAPLLTGTSFVKLQTVDVIDNTPFIVHEYAGGRSLHHIVERARGGAGLTPNPIPIDHAVLIAEKVALSLATTSDLQYAGERLMHGALLPQFVWISDDGEIRVAGQMLGSGIIASLRDAKVGAEVARYFSPESQSSGMPSAGSEVYSLGAILFLVVTGQEPPDPVSGSAFHLTIRSARAMGGGPIPNDIRSIIDKSLAIDRAARYPSVAEMKRDLSALAHGGKYSATTFNLAFYLSTLLRKEVEGEAIDREKETKVNAAPYVAALAEPAPAAAAVPAASHAAAPRRRLPLAVAAAVVGVAILGVGAYFATGPKQQAQPVRASVASAVPAPQPKPPLIPEPIVVGATTATTPATETTAPATATEDEAARKKAFEDAVKQRMQEEMMKLQAQYNRQLQQQQSKNAPILTASLAAPAVVQPPARTEDRSMSAAQLDEQRHDALVARQETAAQQLVPQTPAQQAQSVAPQPVAPAIQEGDVVDVAEVDTAPRPLGEIRPSPPPLAIRQHVQGSVIITAFISENGTVLEARILSGGNRFGVDDAALRAVRSARFSPAMKNGKRVKVWMPLRFEFKL